MGQRSFGRGRLSAELGRVLSVTGRAALIFVLAGLICRCTVRDRYGWSAPLFYATPPGVSVLLLIYTLATAWRRWRPAARAGVVLATFVLLAFLLKTQLNFPSSTYVASDTQSVALAGVRPIRVMFWNVNRLRWGAETIFEAIREYDPDIIGIVEGTGEERPRKLWAERFPDYRAVAGGFGSVLLVRGTVSKVRLVRFLGKSGYVGVTVRPDGAVALPARGDLDAAAAGGEPADGAGEIAGRAKPEMIVWLVDVDSDPFTPRGETLRQLSARSADEHPDVIMGDFNTPLDSVWFNSFRSRFRNAAVERHRGFLASWPNPLPLMMIDHVWIGRRFRTLAAELSSRWPTDHRMVTVELVPVAPAADSRREGADGPPIGLFPARLVRDEPGPTPIESRPPPQEASAPIASGTPPPVSSE